ncbi:MULTISPECIES: polyketide cyclase [unclassified Mesorhizobium]|uniref:polyketide cyclase n=1 Tax=unclassified Mesorhizobium TaxID=325217 RepID=UPI0010937ABF|nr:MULTISPECIES: polyketide cyclase [unclassified Mesorhizobium]TGT81750.1 polyketide cyclase [Mesorhizobium sp. M8A.F.Ca.ET.161.01.1.1]TGV35269.1 polyketide cyclase [Mesorhizobium sp. M8A.F.Ca.ET.142.01.1.1]TIT63660.1 MAG: polyketide cyclase [Mesorhizobium sp.]
MWTNEYTATSPLPAQAIWNALKALHEGRLTYEGSDTFVLHGPFAKGTRVSVTPVGQDTFESVIVDLVDNVTYADETSFGDTTLLFRHTLVPVEGGTQVTHRLDISGPSAAEVGPELGPQISGDFDVSMARLFEQAEALAKNG